MRTLILLAAVVPLLAMGAMARGSGDAVVLADDGDFFYDTNDDCIGDTDSPQGARALRHWHVGLPFVGAAAEVAGGFGCLGGPKTFSVFVPDGLTATLEGRVRYTWDANVPGGCCNDVHVHVTDTVRNELVYSTLLEDGPKPIVPTVTPVLEHPVRVTLGPGVYDVTEDVFSGEHSAWLTRLTLTYGLE